MLYLPAAAGSQGLGEVEGRYGHPQAKPAGPILCSAVGRTLGLPQGNWAPHPRTSLETAEGRAGRLAPWQLGLASQPTPPHQHAHTHRGDIRQGRLQAGLPGSLLPTGPSFHADKWLL